MKNKHVIGFAAACLALAVALIANIKGYTLLSSAQSEKVSCTSTLQIVLPETDHLFNARISMQLDGDDGYFVVYGDVTDNSKSWRMYRQLKFSYHPRSNGWIDIDEFISSKHVEDNLPDSFFNAYIFDVSRKHPRIRLTKVNDGYLVWNSFTPFMLCI
ncbi:hypothetical protein [Enterobacter quasiroggenkampii]|uniref:hypothetical protein n=1 Tax=Enterobacter quasiroggenkampii TaxID=2497436 RepID=UPI0020067195|nr:hypothetical protein [Enterobacter quasiroggenkampii]MCK7310532.1 hypothetical protein [Enterobacter quasiroggenkampii]